MTAVVRVDRRTFETKSDSFDAHVLRWSYGSAVEAIFAAGTTNKVVSHGLLLRRFFWSSLGI